MIEESSEPMATDRITVLEGFGAMRIFLEAIWRRQGKSSEEIAFVLAWISTERNWPNAGRR